MQTQAVILNAPRQLAVSSLDLIASGPGDVLVQTHFSGISAGTEKLLWSGEMPRFPGMGYPLVPGYESVGRIVDAAPDVEERIGEWVFVPGASCYTEARGLFGGTASKLVVPSARAIPVPASLAETGTLCALAATAMHILNGGDAPELIVGHGVLGRLLARTCLALGKPAPTVWDNKAERRTGTAGYDCIAPKDDDRRDYRAIVDVSGNVDVLDQLMGRIARHGEIVLAGFYANRISFAFPAAFQAEARLRVAAEWTADDLSASSALIESGALNLAGLVSHIRPATEAVDAYPAAFLEADCLKMVLDWQISA